MTGMVPIERGVVAGLHQAYTGISRFNTLNDDWEL